MAKYRCNHWKFCDSRHVCLEAKPITRYHTDEINPSCHFLCGFDRRWEKLRYERVLFSWLPFKTKLFKNNVEAKKNQLNADRFRRLEKGRLLVNVRNPKDGYYKDMRLKDVITSLLKILEDNRLLDEYDLVDTSPESNGYTPFELKKKSGDRQWLHGNNMDE